MNISVDVDYSDITDWASEMSAKNSQLPTAEIGDIAVEAVQRTLEEGGRPESPWEPAAKDYGHPLLHDTGALRESIQSTTLGENKVRVDSPLDYARYLDQGTSKMPAREFLYLGEEEMSDIETVIAQHFEE